MFCIPRARALRSIVPLLFTVLAVVLCLFVFAPVLSAQQLSLSGIQSPVEEKSSAKQETPVEVRAARGQAPRGQAPLSRLYDYIKVEASKVRKLSALTPPDIQPQTESKK